MNNEDLTIDKVWFKNLQSYGANVTTVNLNRPGTTIIEGVNLDNGTDGKGANGVGKAQPLYAKILTPTGWTTMGEIKAGDMVLTPCGSEAKVIGTYPQVGLRTVYRVTFEDGRFTDVDEDHIWTVAPTPWEAGRWNPNQSDVTTGEIVAQAALSGRPIELYVPNVTNNINRHKSGVELDCFRVGITLDTIKRNQEFYEDMLNNMTHNERLQLILGALSFSVDIGNEAALLYQADSEDIANFLTEVIRSVGGRALIEEDLQIRIHVPHFDKIIHQLPLSSMKLMKATSSTKHRKYGLKISSIVMLEEKLETKCILIDHHSRLYVTDNYIATHNTTIGTALSLAMFGKPLDNKTKLDDLINNVNKKNMEVGCTFHIGNVGYTIKRTRKTKAGAAGNTVTIWVHDLDGENKKDITPDSVDQCNIFIENLIGIPYDIFTRIVIFSATHTPFLSLPARSQSGPNQSDMIEHVFGLTALTEYAETLKSLNDTDEIELKTKRLLIGAQESEHKRHSDSIEMTKKKLIDWENDRNRKVENLKTKITRAKEISIDEQTKLHRTLAQLTQLKKDVGQELTNDRNSLKRLNANLTKYTNELSHLVDDKCPYCLQQYEGSDDKQTELASNIVETQDMILQLNDVISTKQAKIDEILDEISTTQANIVVSETELKTLSKSESDMKIDLQVAQDQENPFIVVLDELEKQQLQSIDYNEIDELTKVIDHRKFMIKLFTKRDSFVRKQLLDRFIPYLNERLATNLTILGLPHKVEFQPDTTVKITSFGRELGFELLSAGQKARVNIALSWAFRDVYQKRYRKVNLSMLDEVLDIGLDSMGVQSAVKLLKHKSRADNISMFIISHRTDDVGNAFDRKIQVIMEGGFSRVEDNSEDLPLLHEEY